VVVWLIIDVNDRLEHAAITVSIAPGQTEIYRVEVPPEQLIPPAPEGDWVRRYTLHVAVPFINLVLPHEGFIEVNVETEQGNISAGRLKVVVPGRPDPRVFFSEATALPTASPPRSEQSLSDARATKRRTSRRLPSGRRCGRTLAPE
jgi:hypothetical protein